MKLLDALGVSVHPDIDQKRTNNTGVVLVSDALENNRTLYEECYHYTEKFFSKLRLPDQAIMNYVLWKNKVPLTDITTKYNYTLHHDIHGHDTATIFHIAHHPKFWNHSVLRCLFPIWTECYEKWLSLGGTAYEGKQIYRDMGETLSIKSLLEMIDVPEQLASVQLKYAASLSLIREQDAAIKKLEATVEELLSTVQSLKGQRF